MRRAVDLGLWGVGASVLAGPILASIWTPNRDLGFYPALVASLAFGLVAGWIWSRFGGTRLPRLDRLPPSMVVAVGWPVSVFAAIALEVALSEVGLTPSGWAFASALTFLLGGLPLVVRYGSRHPYRSMRVLGVNLTGAATVLVLLGGIGLALLPWGVATWMVGRNLTRRRLASPIDASPCADIGEAEASARFP